MDAASLRSGFTEWQRRNPRWTGFLSLVDCEQGRMHCLLRKENVTFDFEHSKVSHDIPSELFRQWAEVCQALLETPIKDVRDLREFLSITMQEFEGLEWSDGNYKDSTESMKIGPSPVPNTNPYSTHVVFQHAREARDFIRKEAEYAKTFDIEERTDITGVKLGIQLSKLGIGADSCDKLGIFENERTTLTFTFRESQLRATAEIGWTASLFNEIEFFCNSGAGALRDELSLYIPAVVKIFLNRQADKYLKEHDAVMGAGTEEMMLINMGFALKDVRDALKKSNQNSELALEKLIKWAAAREWVYTESPNPFINLCMSLKTFLSSHTQYCRNCYKRHRFPSQILRHCLKNSCALHPLNSDTSDNAVVKELQRNFDGVKMYLSFITAAKENAVKMCSERLLSGFLECMKGLKHIKNQCHSDTEVREFLCAKSFRGQEFYNTLRRVVQTNSLFLTPKSIADIEGIYTNFALSSVHLRKVYEVKGAEATEFQSEKVLYGSCLGLFGAPNSSWYQIVTEGHGAILFARGKTAEREQWTASDLQAVLQCCEGRNVVEEWLPIANSYVVAVVEAVEKPGYRQDSVNIIDTWKHFAIRYLLLIRSGNGSAYDLSQPSIIQSPSLDSFSSRPDNPPPPHPPSIPDTTPPISTSIPPHSLPKSVITPPVSTFIPPLSPRKSATTPPASTPAQGQIQCVLKSDYTLLHKQPSQPSAPRKELNVSSLSEAMKEEYRKLAATFEHHQFFSKAISDYFEIAESSRPRMRVRLAAPDDFTIWEVDVEVTDLGLPASFVSQLSAASNILRFKLAFSTFFPALPPLISLIERYPTSGVVDEKGHIINKPLWFPDYSLKDQLIRIIAYISGH